MAYFTSTRNIDIELAQNLSVKSATKQNGVRSKLDLPSFQNRLTLFRHVKYILRLLKLFFFLFILNFSRITRVCTERRVHVSSF